MQTTHRLTEPSSTPSQVKLMTVFGHDIGPVWDDISGFIVSALKYSDGKYTAQDVKERIEGGEMQLFLAVENGIPIASAVTEMKDFPQKRVLTIFLTGGTEMEKWLHLLNQLEKWAISEGCDQMEVLGRPGWEKVLKWEKTYTAFRKDFNEVKH